MMQLAIPWVDRVACSRRLLCVAEDHIGYLDAAWVADAVFFPCASEVGPGRIVSVVGPGPAQRVRVPSDFVAAPQLHLQPKDHATR